MKGYVALAQRMAMHPELAILRSFRAIRLRDLLYLQAELIHLEKSLDDEVQRNMNSQCRNEQWFSRDWLHLSRPELSTDEHCLEWRLFKNIRSKIREYGKCFSTNIQTS